MFNLLAQIFRTGPQADLLPKIRAIPQLADAFPGDADPDGWGAAHYDLFGLNVFPYASTFLEPERTLGGDVTQWVNAFYHRAGFAPATSSESPDHIATELDALTHLDAPHAAEFIDQHLLWWLVPFVEAVRAKESSAKEGASYTPLADLTLETVLAHRASLPRIAGAPPMSFRPPKPGSILDREKTGLKQIAWYLLTPVYSGIYLSRDDLHRLGRAHNLPRGFGDRAIMLSNLLYAAVDYGQLAGLVAGLQEITEHWRARYEFWGSRPPLKGICALWGERAQSTGEMLSRLGSEILNAEVDMK